MTRGLDWSRLSIVTALAVAIALGCRHFFKSEWLEVAAFITGVVAVYLVAVEHILNWPIGIINVSLYAWVFYDARLLADMSLQLFFLALAIHGWWSWTRGGAQHTSLTISRLSATGAWIALAVIVLGTAAYKPVIEHYKGAQPLWDTSLTMLSVVAQVLLNRKILENWVLWIIADIAYIPLYLSRNLYPTAILYGLFLLLALMGLRNWNHRFQTDTAGV